jgi:hypothetical protein
MGKKKNNELEYKIRGKLFSSSIAILLPYYHFVNLTHKFYIPLFKEYTLIGGCGV